MSDKTGYDLISADAHVFEPSDLFEKRLPNRVRDRAPKVDDWNGGSAWFVENVVPVPFPASAVTGSGYRLPNRSDQGGAVSHDDLMPGLRDPAERIKVQDLDSVDAEVLYASPHLWDAIKQVDDGELRLECARAYNDWISEFCSHDPQRLLGVGKIPTSGVDDARDELVRCIDELGLRGAVIDAWPDGSKGPSDLALDPIWDVANQAGIPISLHYGLGDARSAPTAAIAPGLKPPVATALLPLVASGVFDRFPNLRMVLAHGDAGWCFHWMEFLDNTYMRQRHLERFKLEREDSYPSEYMRRHFWFTIQQDRATVKHRDLIGAEHLLWASHFPLDASNWPDNRQQAVRVTEELPAEDKRALLAGNTARLYGLPGYEDGISPTPFESIERLVHI
jgi:predicted TIM-barrel fold metal-dependent hydrolase